MPTSGCRCTRTIIVPNLLKSKFLLYNQVFSKHLKTCFFFFLPFPPPRIHQRPSTPTNSSEDSSDDNKSDDSDEESDSDDPLTSSRGRATVPDRRNGSGGAAKPKQKDAEPVSPPRQSVIAAAHNAEVGSQIKVKFDTGHWYSGTILKVDPQRCGWLNWLAVPVGLFVTAF